MAAPVQTARQQPPPFTGPRPRRSLRGSSHGGRSASVCTANQTRTQPWLNLVLTKSSAKWACGRETAEHHLTHQLRPGLPLWSAGAANYASESHKRLLTNQEITAFSLFLKRSLIKLFLRRVANCSLNLPGFILFVTTVLSPRWHYVP